MGSTHSGRVWRSGFRPLVVILGATGTGKTKLSVEVATHFGGEIVSADSMQIYKGLPIGTNQATLSEQAGVPHHMLAFLPPTTLGFTVVQYQAAVLAHLDDIWARGRLPVLVGGTAYYVESILWDLLLSEPSAEPFERLAQLPKEWAAASNEELHRKLSEVDPETAAVTDSRNRRKTSRALNTFFQLGATLHSMRERHAKKKAKLRFPSSLIMWLTAEKSVLDARLEARIHTMVAAGLRAEIETFHDAHMEEYRQALELHTPALGEGDAEEGSCEKGIFQSLALKEFLPYLRLPPSQRVGIKGDRHFRRGLDELATGTRQYARRQDRWVANRILRKADREQPPLYRLDTSEPQKWTELVQDRATAIVEALLAEAPCPIPPTPLDPDPLSSEEKNRLFDCLLCRKKVYGRACFEAHLKGKEHRHNVKMGRMLSELGPGEAAAEPSLAELNRILQTRKSQLKAASPTEAARSSQDSDDELATLFQ